MQLAGSQQRPTIRGGMCRCSEQSFNPPVCRALQEFRRVLAQGGCLIITGDDLQPCTTVQFAIIGSSGFEV